MGMKKNKGRERPRPGQVGLTTKSFWHRRTPARAERLPRKAQPSKNLNMSLKEMMPSTRLLPASTMMMRLTPEIDGPDDSNAIPSIRILHGWQLVEMLTRVGQPLHHFLQRIRAQAHMASLPVEETKRRASILSELQSLGQWGDSLLVIE